MNHAAVAAVFISVGIVTATLVIAIIFFIVRRRAKRVPDPFPFTRTDAIQKSQDRRLGKKQSIVEGTAVAVFLPATTLLIPLLIILGQK